MALERVSESFSFSGGTVDESGPYPVIRGALICGLKSVHGYDYDPRCWENGRAKEIYEGLDSYVGHKDGERDPREKLGWWENVRTRPDGRPEGDYCVCPEHPMAKTVVWAAKHKPDFVKFSHVADVKKAKQANGRIAVESIGKAHSIDLVSTGGTTGSLLESGHKRKGNTVALVKEYGNKLAPKCTVEQLLKLRWLVKEDGMGDVPMPSDAPDPVADATSGDQGIDAAFMAAATAQLQACMDAKGDPAVMKKCLGKLKKLLMAHGEIKAEDAPETTEDDPVPDPAKESGKGKAKPAASDPWELIAECEREQYRPDAIDLKVLKTVSESGDRLAYIRRQKGLVNATDPKSKGREQLAGGDKGGTTKESGAGGNAAPAGGIEEARQKMAQLSKDARGAS